MEEVAVSVLSGEEGERLDLFLVKKLNGISRTAIQKMLKGGLVTLGGKPLPANRKTSAAEEYRVSIPPEEPLNASPENIPLEVVYEDADIVVINKPAGMVVHPAKGHTRDTMVNALLYMYRDNAEFTSALAAADDEEETEETAPSTRPGIVHRLDKETTGLIAVAKNAKAHASLSEQLRSREMGREYLAVVRGVVTPMTGTIEKPIGRHKIHRKKMTVNSAKSSRERPATTLYETIEVFPGSKAALLKVRLKTGRTHQIRVHLSSVGHPIMGDIVYGKEKSKLIGRPALHAAKLTLVHPSTGEQMEFSAPLPADFEQLLKSLRGR